jgi:hypothetical protein
MQSGLRVVEPELSDRFPPEIIVIDAPTPHPDIRAGPKGIPVHETFGSLVEL